MGVAHQLVRPDVSHDSLVVDEGIAQKLLLIQGPIAVVSVLGSFHSGKSYLLNRLVNATEQEGFGIGTTTQPKTQGLWVWLPPIEIVNKDGETVNVLVIDTEGLNAPDTDKVYDSKLFSVATLISSLLLYNTVKIIDSEEIDRLEFLAWNANNFYSKAVHDSNNSGFQRPINMPNLTVIVQGFHFNLDKDITTTSQWFSRMISKHKRSREQDGESGNLLHIFPHVECVGLPLPTAHPQLLNNLMIANDKELQPNYIIDVETVKSSIWNDLNPKKVEEKTVTGLSFVQLLRFLVHSANNGSHPHFSSEWNYLFEVYSHQAVEDAQFVFSNLMNDGMKGALTTAEFEQLFVVAVEAAKSRFRQSFFSDETRYNKSIHLLTEALNISKSAFLEKNGKNILEFLHQLRLRLEETFEAFLRNLIKPKPADEYSSLNEAEIARLAEKFSQETKNFEHTSIPIELTTLTTALRLKFLDSEKRNNKLIVETILNVFGQARANFIEAFADETASSIKIKIPTTTSSVQLSFDESYNAALNFLSEHLSRFSDVSEYKIEISRFEHVSEKTLQNVKRYNTDVIQAKCSALYSAIDEKFQAVASRWLNTPPLSRERFLRKFEEFLDESTHEYDKNTDNLKEEEIVASNRASIILGLQRTFVQFEAKNNELVKNFLMQLSQEILADSRESVGALVLPTRDDVLSEKFHQIKALQLERLNSMASDFSSQLEFAAEKDILANEFNKMEILLLNKNRKDKQSMFENVFAAGIQAYRLSLDSIPDTASTAKEILTYHEQGLKNAWVELSKIEAFQDELPHKFGRISATSELERLLEEVVRNVGRHIDLKMEYYAKEVFLKFKSNLEKLYLGSMPRHENFVDAKIKHEEDQALVNFETYINGYVVNGDESIPSRVFRAIAAERKNDLIVQLQQGAEFFRNLNLKTLRSITAIAQSQALEVVKQEYATNTHLWLTTTDFDRWVENSLKDSMAKQIDNDHSLKELLTSERMTAKEAVELVVTKSALLSEDFSSLPEDIKTIVEEVHQQIQFRNNVILALIAVVATLALRFFLCRPQKVVKPILVSNGSK